jgi:hypothetical protein
MKARLLIAIISAAVVGSLQAQINVGANTITGTDSSVYAGSSNTNAGNNSAIGGSGNAIAANASVNFIGGGSHNSAGGSTATIAGGANGIATNFASIGGGLQNKATATAATVPGGAYAIASHFGQMAYSSQKLANDGDSQSSLFTLRITTASATETELSLSNDSFPGIRMTVGSGGVWSFRALITAKRASNGNAAGWEIKGVIKNVGGTTSLVGVTKTELGKDVAGWDANISADDTNDALVIKVVGEASATISWTAAVNTAELN